MKKNESNEIPGNALALKKISGFKIKNQTHNRIEDFSDYVNAFAKDIIDAYLIFSSQNNNLRKIYY